VASSFFKALAVGMECENSDPERDRLTGRKSRLPVFVRSATIRNQQEKRRLDFGAVLFLFVVELVVTLP
jgi:hypothetical protein